MIIGGVSFATMLTSFVIPALYLILARFTRPVSFIAKKLTQMESDARPAAGHHVPAE